MMQDRAVAGGINSMQSAYIKVPVRWMIIGITIEWVQHMLLAVTSRTCSTPFCDFS